MAFGQSFNACWNVILGGCAQFTCWHEMVRGLVLGELAIDSLFSGISFVDEANEHIASGSENASKRDGTKAFSASAQDSRMPREVLNDRTL